MRSLLFYAKEVSKKLPLPIYKILSRCFVSYQIPRHLFIETTKRCNFSCSYCPRHKSNEDMDFQLFKRIIDQCSQRPMSFSLHLFGEPLLWPHFSDGLSYIRAKNKRHEINITTNGWFLDSYIDNIVKQCCNVIWSYHDGNADSRISKETEKKLKTLNFRVRSFDGNVSERWKKWLEIREYHNYGGKINLSRYGVLNTVERYPCYHLWLAPAVSLTGKMLACCADVDENLIIGDLTKNTIQEIWKSQEIRKLRFEHLNKIYHSTCSKCDVWKTYPSLF